MTKSRKRLLLFTSPITISLFLTLIGLIFNYVPLISLSGLILWLLLFILFAFSDRLVLWMKAFREKKLSFGYFIADPKLDSSVKIEIAKTLSELPIGITLILRGIFLTLSFWVIDFYFSLCDGGIWGLFDQIPQSLGGTLATATITMFEISRGKTLRKQGHPTRLLSIIGAFSFYRSFVILSIGGGDGAQSFRAMKEFLSNPLWFLSNQQNYQVLQIIFNMGLPYAFLIFCLFPFLFICISKDLLSQPTTEDNVDSKNFAIALIIFCCWMMTLPMFYLYVFLNRLN